MTPVFCRAHSSVAIPFDWSEASSAATKTCVLGPESAALSRRIRLKRVVGGVPKIGIWMDHEVATKFITLEQPPGATGDGSTCPVLIHSHLVNAVSPWCVTRAAGWSRSAHGQAARRRRHDPRTHPRSLCLTRERLARLRTGRRTGGQTRIERAGCLRLKTHPPSATGECGSSHGGGWSRALRHSWWRSSAARFNVATRRARLCGGSSCWPQ
jgi:hypothetical protein